MLKLVVAAAVMLHVVASKPFTPWTSEDKAKSASKPMDVNVEVTVNGVKIPINLDKYENSDLTLPRGYQKGEEASNRQGVGLDKYENSMGQKGPWVNCFGVIC